VNIKPDRPVDPRDPVLDFNRVLEIARRHLPVAETVTGLDETGNQARVYVIDDDFIFKTQRPHKKARRDLGPAATWPVVSYADLEKECFLLRHVEAHVPELKAPRALGYGLETDVEYLLMTRVRGVRMGELIVAGEARLRLLHEIGAQLRRLHSLPVEPLRQSGLFPGDRDPTDIRARVERLLHSALESASAQQIQWKLGTSLESVAVKIVDTVSRLVDEPVTLHSNPSPDHVMLNAETLELSGLIDFGDAYFSHPAIDTRRWRMVEDRRALLAGYASVPPPPGGCFFTTWYAMLTMLQIHEVVFRRAVRDEALAALHGLLADW
jgi:hygromycin-B 7''-O-kinase